MLSITGTPQQVQKIAGSLDDVLEPQVVQAMAQAVVHPQERPDPGLSGGDK